jgi:hypothetical protein
MDENTNIENMLAQQIIVFLGDYDEETIIKTITILASALIVTNTVTHEELSESIRQTVLTHKEKN